MKDDDNLEYGAKYGVTTKEELIAAIENGYTISLETTPSNTEPGGIACSTKTYGNDWFRLTFKGDSYVFTFDSISGWSYEQLASTDYQLPSTGIPLSDLSPSLVDEIRGAYEISGPVTPDDIGKVITVALNDQNVVRLMPKPYPTEVSGPLTDDDIGKVITVVSDGNGGVELRPVPVPTEISGTISDDDIGKVITVVSDGNGGVELSPATPPTELPAVTEADNGKILGISGGAWSKESFIELLINSGLLTPDLATDSWATISAISASGNAANYYAVGDCKQITLSGTVGTLSVDTTTYIYILGFNHNAAIEGNGISFGGFKTTAGNDAVDVCLKDGNSGSMLYDGTKAFNMNHWGDVSLSTVGNYGGWAGCDLRYDILGSTNVAPSGYGLINSAGRVGYNPTSDCASTPVSNTLMSCLPADLRAVMKPITKYTDNVASLGGNNVQANVTASIDYLPLLSEYEIVGRNDWSNIYEANNQAQYAYYAAGNSAKKYAHNDTSTVCSYWLRSPTLNNNYGASNSAFAFITGTTGDAAYTSACASLGISPIILV